MIKELIYGRHVVPTNELICDKVNEVIKEINRAAHEEVERGNVQRYDPCDYTCTGMTESENGQFVEYAAFKNKAYNNVVYPTLPPLTFTSLAHFEEWWQRVGVNSNWSPKKAAEMAWGAH
jgi:hypothetical protein